MPLRRSTLVPALALALSLQGAAGPDAALESVKETLSAAHDAVTGDGTREEKLASLRAVARLMLDTRAMGRRAIGDVLEAQPPDQQAEYLELFDHVIVRAYLQKLLLFRKPRFEYHRPERQGEIVLVRTRIITPKDEYSVDYEMLERDGRWVATDVIVEGVSLSDNYHEQFASLLRGRSFEELLELMRQKTAGFREKPT